VIPAREPDEDPPPRKYYYDQGHAEIVAHWVREFDRNGYQLRTVKFTDYTGEQVRTLVPSAEDFRRLWLDPDRRAEALTLLAARGIDLDTLLAESGQLEADIFDLLCATAYGLPVRTRRERADRVRKERRAFLERYQPLARAVLEDLLEKYAAHGLAQWALPEALKVPPISNRGTVLELIRAFGGEEPLRQAIEELEMMLYAA
jgi:type I restriction enzyme R subunit